eukprot:TRINITY_DN1308_c0_g1_i2.p1 TRINITY_DN1308_c0_g1~~TRINITY_DN1308_c0_g1_i2.p1  ORF type:complete len:496 (+),score=65.14 TRINITY_DN1308_c0_g1_i2:61-1488(+)
MTDFSDSGSRIMDKTIHLSEAVAEMDNEDIESVFELDRCEGWIKEKDLQRVALQFPDYLLKNAPAVAKGLGTRLSREVFILGDTSYGECCVDEVAAEHLNADGIIHFGHTCLTPSQRLPVLYVFTIKHIDTAALGASLRKKFCEDLDILMIYDVEYDHALRNFSLQDWRGRIVVGEPIDATKPLAEGCIRKFGRQFQVSSLDELKNFKVVYVTSEARESVKIYNFLFSFSGSEFYVYDKNGLDLATRSVQKQLMKRYFLIEKTKDAERIGILVGTLGVANFNDIISRLRSLIKKSGKKSYTFLVGKLNPQKLANFPEVEVFVLVACPETSFPDSSEFFQSVVTPYELEIALNSSREWGGQYYTDFRDLLSGGEGYLEPGAEHGEDEAGDHNHEPDVSLVTGRVRAGGLAQNYNGNGELMTINDRTVSQLHQGGGGEFLASRSWSGLEQKLGGTEVEPLVQGRPGIAQQYQGEGES